MVEIKYLKINELLKFRANYTILDVRTPSEYLKGHIPGAINLPIFSDDDRIRIGTLYKQKGRREAVLKGFELVGPNIKSLLLEADQYYSRKIILHCWRGGLRSYTMSWMLNLYGIKNQVLEGGYKSYRKKCKEYLATNSNLWVLSGMTGSGKTEILHALKEKGEQVIDLENLAHHRGSAFGKIFNEKQLPNEQFENNLGEEWMKFDLNKPIWIEDEGRTIGSNFIPDELYNQMRNSPVIKIEIPLKCRVSRLVKDYADCNKDILIQNIDKITKRLGGQNAQAAIQGINKGNLNQAVEKVLLYYDKAYKHGLSKREASKIFPLKLTNNHIESNSIKILEYQKKLRNDRY